MTNAEHNAAIDAQIDALIATRASYDAIARTGSAAIYRDNAREQAAILTGHMAQLRAAKRNY